MFPVYLCLLLSGASSLIYETVWTRQLAYWFSGTAVTSSLVLTAFMAGMAAGAWFAGRKLTRLASPLKAYVFVELGLAATGVMFPGMIQTVGGWYLKWLAGTSIPPAMLATLKFTSFVIVLGIPSFLMGVTLPLLVLAIGTRRGQAGSEVGRLYAANNLGAVLGTLAAGFWLIESMGVTGTSQAGAIGNVGAALMAMILESRQKSSPAPDDDTSATNLGEHVRESISVNPQDEPGADPRDGPAEETPAKKTPAKKTPAKKTPAKKTPAKKTPAKKTPAKGAPRNTGRTIPSLGILMFCSGFTALGYEILWMRVLPLILGSSTYSFSLVVATFISGLTIGSLIYARWHRKIRDPLMTLGLAQCTIGLWVLTTVPLYSFLPVVFVVGRNVLGLDFEAYRTAAMMMNATVILIPSILYGIGLPLAVQTLSDRGDRDVHTTVGDLYAANTLGNVLGALAIGLAWIPAFGSPLAFQLVSIVNILTGLIFLRHSPAWSDPKSDVPSHRVQIASVLIFTTLLIGPSISRSWIHQLATGGYSRAPIQGLQRLKRQIRVGENNVIFHHEDQSSIVSVTEDHGNRSLWISGKPDASTTGDLQTQGLVGHVGPMFHPDPRSAFILGLGSGMTAYSLLKYPFETVLCAEMSAGVIAALPAFESVNGRVWEDPRLRIVNDDGRHILQSTGSQFDVIVSEPSNPWMAGITNVFTREFLEAARGHLNPDGIMVEWAHTYEMDIESFQMILRTFQDVFPIARSFRLGGDMIVIGAINPDSLDANSMIARVRKAFAVPSIGKHLATCGFSHEYALLESEWFRGPDLRRFTGQGNLLTDDFPVLEFTAPVAYYSGTSVDLPSFHVGSPSSLREIYLRGRDPTTEELLSFGKLRMQMRRPEGLESYLLRPEQTPTAPLLFMASESLIGRGRVVESLPLVRQAWQLDPDNTHYLESYMETARRAAALNLPQRRDVGYADLEVAVNALLERVPDRWTAHDIRIRMYLEQQRPEQASNALRIAGTFDPSRSRSVTLSVAWVQVGYLFFDLGRFKDARDAVGVALDLNPDSPGALQFMGELDEATSTPGS